MSRFRRSGRSERELQWAKIWFEQLAAFHHRQGQADWPFTADDVIAFSRMKRDLGMPASKRMLMARGLIHYRQRVQNRPADDLIPIYSKLKEIAVRERCDEAEVATIKELAGKIDPREPDVIRDYRRTLRRHGRKYSTERAYVGKLRGFMSDRGLKCRADFDGIGGAEVEAYLTDLAVDGNVAPSTQNQAFHALLFLFEHVFQRDIGRIQAIRATKRKQVPTVLSHREVDTVLSELKGVSLLIAQLLYGCGLRISEALQLRIKDIDFENSLLEINQSKGSKSRIVPLPEHLVEPLRRQIQSRQVLHQQDVADGVASVWLPGAVAKKHPSAASQWRWQFLLAAHRLSRDPRSGEMHRHHLHRETFASHLRHAVERAGITKHVTAHVFRHSFATQLLRQGAHIRTIQELLGHSDVTTTMIYAHAANRKDGLRVISPIDQLMKESPEPAVSPANRKPGWKETAKVTPDDCGQPFEEAGAAASSDGGSFAAVPVEKPDRVAERAGCEPKEMKEDGSTASPVSVLEKDADPASPEVTAEPETEQASGVVPTTLEPQSPRSHCPARGDADDLSAIFQSIARQAVQNPSPRSRSSLGRCWLPRWLPSLRRCSRRVGSRRPRNRRWVPFAVPLA